MRRGGAARWLTVMAAAWIAASLVAIDGGAHPGHGPLLPHESEPLRKPTQEQIDKRLERVVKQAEARKKDRTQRQGDRRRALRKRLYHRLRGGPITPDVKAELALHAKRTAWLRQIRYVAAEQKDYDTVLGADKALARENSRHEAWWRSTERAAAKPATSADAGAKP